MNMPHEGASIAILIANGFEEEQITAVQKTLTQEKLDHKIIAPEQGLVNGWRNGGWGHHFSVDQHIGTAMGSDYDLLVLAGGNMGVDKLLLTNDNNVGTLREGALDEGVAFSCDFVIRTLCHNSYEI